MAEQTRVQWLRVFEFMYAVLALFALTQGPVIRLWRPSEAILDSLPSPSILHAHFATYAAAQLPAMLLWARRVDRGWWSARHNQILLLLLGWLGCTVLWSTFARHSLPEFLALVFTTVFGLYLAISYSARQFWLVVAAAMSLGVALSWVAVMRLWDGAVNFQENYWIGIYFNRNSLAPVTAIAILASLGFVSTSWSADVRRVTFRGIATLVAVIAVIALSLIELWMSGSQTSPTALAVAAAVCLLWFAFHQLINRWVDDRVIRSLSVPLILTGAAIVMFAALTYGVGAGGVETETTAFNQRSGLWSLSWAGILDKPWLGWGWMSAWHTPLFFLANDEPTWMAWGLEWSHNGYHDVLLAGGAPAGLLLFAYLAIASRRIGAESPASAVPRLMLVVFVLAAATQESFFIGSHFLWALLTATMALAPATMKSDVS